MRVLGVLAAGTLALTAGVQAASAEDLIVAVQKNPDVVEPMRDFSNVGMRVIYNLAETLIERDFKDDQRLVPGLAESWTRVDDRTIDFTLRQGVTCHNGEPLTAEDVAFTFGKERFQGEDAPGKRIGSILLGNLEPPEVLGEHKVRIRSKVPDAVLENRLASYTAQIICKDAYLAAENWDSWSKALVATGPYKLTEFKPGESIRIERFDDYWGEKAPADSVTFTVVPEAATRLAGLLAGDFHIVTEVEPDQLADIDARSGVVSAGGPIRNIRILLYDSMNGSALEDPRIRQAMNLAIDRQLIVDALLHGRAKVPHGMQFDGYGEMFVAEAPKLVYDPEKARALIAEAGYDGAPITLRTVGNYYAAERDTSEAIVNMWRDVGLDAQLVVVENWDQIYEDNEARNAQNSSATGFLNDPVGHLWRRFGPNDTTQKRGFWTNAEFNELGGKLEASTDMAERRALVARMLEIVDEDPPGALLFELPIFYGKVEGVNWQPYAHEYMDLRAGNLSFD
ncbi:MAG: ABC transporter substrate-binding protein [Rhodospirillales bacterium]